VPLCTTASLLTLLTKLMCSHNCRCLQPPTF